MNFTKSMLGLFGGAAAGLFAAIVFYWFGEYRCAVNGDPTNQGPLVGTLFTIPMFSFFGAVMGCKIAERFWIPNSSTTELENQLHGHANTQHPTLWNYFWLFIAAFIIVGLLTF